MNINLAKVLDLRKEILALPSGTATIIAATAWTPVTARTPPTGASPAALAGVPFLGFLDGPAFQDSLA